MITTTLWADVLKPVFAISYFRSYVATPAMLKNKKKFLKGFNDWKKSWRNLPECEDEE